MPPLSMIAVAVVAILVLGYFAYAAFTMAHAESVARRKAQRAINDSLGRMNPHAMRRFLGDLATFKDWRDTPDPYGIPDEAPQPQTGYVKRPAGNHQTYFAVDGDDARLAAVVIAHSTGPSEAYDA